jgi:predicted dehydrogenase
MAREFSRIRYAVVGLGWIAQESVLPGFKSADKNSELVALVTGDPEKARKVGEEYGVAKTISYEGYDELLQSGLIDAVYIAVPNHLHADFTIRAAKAYMSCARSRWPGPWKSASK